MIRSSVSRANRTSPAGSSPVARRSTLGWPGLLFVGITVFLAIGAINSQNNLLFWVFGVAVAGVIVSGVVSGSGLMGVRLQATVPQNLEAGSPAELHYTLGSINRRLSVFGLEIREKDPDPALSITKDDATSVSHLGPGTHRHAGLRWTPQRRGPIELDRVMVESRFPFGLLIKSLEFSAPRRLLVMPARIEIIRSPFEPNRASTAAGHSKRTRSGAGTEFYAIREYTPGDPRRTIAWRPSARRGALLVVEHTEPRSRSAWVWVTAPSEPTAQARPRTQAQADARVIAERALALALAIIREGTRQQRPVGLWMPWAGLTIPPGSGKVFERRVAERLAALDLHPSTASASGTGPPPESTGSDMLVIALGPTPTGAHARERGSVFDLRDPAAWLAPGSSLPAVLQISSEHAKP